MDLFIAGTAIGIDEPIVAEDVTVDKLQKINAELGRHYVVERHTRSGPWQWTIWYCPKNPKYWLRVGVRNLLPLRPYVGVAQIE